jgi:penicillin-binding protein 1A
MRWVLYPFLALVSLAVLGFATLALIAAIAWPDLPTLDVLTDYQPQIPLRVYTADGHLLGEFGEERRDYVPIADVPPLVRDAILAAEDERFYEHAGVDLVGVARAAMANLTSGGRGQGASTITMQVARNFFLTREKTFNRKLYEILLAYKIERNLSKDQILEIYLNQIFLGQRAYGFSAAARIYFGKTLPQLNVAEAAMLAGLPKAPSAYNPISNPRRASLRQQYVLRRMSEAGFIDAARYQEALNTPIKTVSFREATPPEDYVAEFARQIAVEQFGNKAYTLGINIITTVMKDEQEAAIRALRQGVLDFDRRRGYRGPEAFVDLTGVQSEHDEKLDDLMLGTPDYGELLAALVLEVKPQAVTVYRRGEIIEIKGDGLKFAAPMLSEKAPQTRRIRRGAIVRIRALDNGKWALLQLPEIESALLSIDAQTGAVRAMVGGFDPRKSQFNHATQAERQPGSSFKPFIYSAALEKGFGPATPLEDAPLYFPPEVTGSKAWEPKNYDGKFDGIMTLRTALARSKNTISIRILESMTPQYAQEYLTRFGFDARKNPPYLTMALGAGSATPWQMASAYAVFANGGYRIEPYLVSRIMDAQGRTLAQFDPPVAGISAPQVIDARNAFLIDSMLQDVVKRGTATRAKELKRNDLAGKTGTTNDYLDAWFCGYNPDVVAVVWIGYSQPRNMGKGETGGKAALPIWIDYMKTALKGVPERTRPIPEGLVRVSGIEGDDYSYVENPLAPPPMPTFNEPTPIRDFQFRPGEELDFEAPDSRPAMRPSSERVDSIPPPVPAPPRAPEQDLFRFVN